MSRWRFGHGWSEAELERYLTALGGEPVNFAEAPDAMTAANGWTIDGAKTSIGTEAPGPPELDGLFTRARQALINYDFSDPRIVVAHFDPQAALLGRTMLLEIKVWRLHFLGGVRVQQVRDETTPAQSLFGFRYDTLQGHIESGVEWFLLTKDHHTGAIQFQIEAHWRLGQFPTWWSKLGFKLVGEHYRDYWRRAAAGRLQRLARQPVEKAVAVPGELAHRGDTTPQRTEPTGATLRRRPGSRPPGA